MIQLENLVKIYQTAQGPVRSLDGVNLAVKPGEFIVVHGRSGSGKTTLLLTIGGMLHPSAGRVTVDGQDVYAAGQRERAQFRARKIGFVFQMYHLVPYLHVLDNVLLAGTSEPGGVRLARARELLTQLGLETRWSHKPAELSAGERQRTAIARALLPQPKLVLADEPTGNLDPENGAEVFRHLAEYHRQGGTVIVATHGPAADQFADRIIELQAGSINLKNAA
jgi:putative ABC transport system ATP-binding protein